MSTFEKLADMVTTQPATTTPSHDCPPPPDIPNAVKLSTLVKDWGEGDTVTYACREGFQQSGWDTYQCNAGSWSVESGKDEMQCNGK